MASFLKALEFLGGVEGGYANDEHDRGGETYRGISRKFWPAWYGWQIIDNYKTRSNFPASLEADADLQARVDDFYKANFWDAMHLDLVSHQELATELFDGAVNLSLVVEGIMLQEILNVANQGGRFYPDLKVDGQVGQVTITALNAHPRPAVILKALNCEQGHRYFTIAKANPSQEAFYNGWMDKRVRMN